MQTGDFGRPRPSVWNDLVLPAAGSAAAAARGEPVSPYPYTDDEEELRDRAWRFLMPAHERSWLERSVAEWVRTRILPVAAQPRDRTSYHRALLSEDFRSPASRYRRLSEDAVADGKLLGPFAAVAVRVLAADRLRRRSLPFIDGVTEKEAGNALARVAENRCLIAWVVEETAGRAERYRYALERLFMEAPQPESVAAERAVMAFDAHRRTLDGLGAPTLPACAAVDRVGGPGEGAPPRYLPRHNGPKASPLVTKG